MLIQIDTDIYAETVWTLSQVMSEKEYTKRDKTGEVRLIYKIFIIINLKSFHTTCRKMKKI